MSTPAILLWDQAYNRNGDPNLPRAVVNVIRTYADNRTLTGWVKAETLARATGLQVRGVRKQIAANVAAGWLEVAERGNSSGKANTYRLMYPKGVPDDTIAQGADHSKGVLQDTIGESKGVLEDTEGCPTGPVNGVLQDTPTTPRTTPRTSPRSSIETDPRRSVIDLPPNEKAGQSKGVLQDTIADPDPFDAPPDFTPWPPPKRRQPVTAGSDWGDPDNPDPFA